MDLVLQCVHIFIADFLINLLNICDIVIEGLDKPKSDISEGEEEEEY